MAKVLTQLVAERFKPPKQGRIIHWDALVPGFGLRISDKGARSWVAMYRVNCKSVMQTLGTLALIPKVDDARQRAGSHHYGSLRYQPGRGETCRGGGAGDLRCRR